MMKWSPWPAAAPETRRVRVRVKVVRVEGLGVGAGEEGKVAAVEMRWKGPRTGGLPGFKRRDDKRTRKHLSEKKVIDNGVAQFGEEFEHVCGLPVLQKDQTLGFGSWVAQISLLYGAAEREGKKLSIVGTTSLNIGEIASQLQGHAEATSELERTIPFPLKIAGVCTDSLLYITINFLELRTSQESSQALEGSSFLKRVRNYVSSSGRANKNRSPDTDESGGACDTEDEPCEPPELAYGSITWTSSTLDESSRYYGHDVSRASNKQEITRSQSLPVGGFLSWRKRKLSFRDGRSKGKTLLKKGNEEDSKDDIANKNVDHKACKYPPSDSGITDVDSKVGNWEEKEIISRDGQVKIKSDVLFASIDQRSDTAAGEGACAVLVAVISNWLHSNPGRTPTRSEFDSLIIEGSSEWQKLCNNQSHLHRFPDKHFDLETVLEAGIRPVSVDSQKSFIGFFSPERFGFLDGAMSFDVIWNDISRITDGEEHIYIVSWNDHFFILKADSRAFYLIDTLGERLFEGCNQGYIIRFDEHTRISRAAEKEDERVDSSDRNDDEGRLMCSGRDCCKEFIKRFLAAIPLREVEEAAKKEMTSILILYHKLQIELHLSEASSPGSSQSTSPLSSPSWMIESTMESCCSS